MSNEPTMTTTPITTSNVDAKHSQKHHRCHRQKGTKHQNGTKRRAANTKVEIAKVSDVIRKKCLAMKIGKMDTEAAVDASTRPIVEPLKRLIENASASKTHSTPRSRPVNRKHEYDQQQSSKRFQPITPSIIKEHPNNLPDSSDDDDDDDDDDDYDDDDADDTDNNTNNDNNNDNDNINNNDVDEVVDEDNVVDDVIDDVVDDIVDEDNGKNHDDESSVKTYDLDMVRKPVDDIEVYVRNAKGPLSRQYLRLFFTDNMRLIDDVYGVYLGPDEDLMIGDSVLTIDADCDDIRVSGTRYPGTRGLYELLFMREPNQQTCTDADFRSRPEPRTLKAANATRSRYFRSYRRILLSTSAHKQNHSPSKRTLGNKGYKYTKIISQVIGGVRTSNVRRVRGSAGGAGG